MGGQWPRGPRLLAPTGNIGGPQPHDRVVPKASNTHVGVDERVVALRVTADLERTVRDHLVGVHVRRRARTTLDHTDGELVVEASSLDLFAGGVDEVRPLFIKRPDLQVGPGRRLLHTGEGTHEVGVDGDRSAGDREVLHRSRRVHTPIRCSGDLKAADRIGLGTGRCGNTVGHRWCLLSS